MSLNYSSDKKQLLDNHKENVHEKKRIFKCKECDREFGKYNHLKKHIQIIHQKIKPFKCEVSNKIFIYIIIKFK